MQSHPTSRVARASGPRARPASAIELLARMREALQNAPPGSVLSVSAVADALGMSRATLYRRVKDCALDPPMDLIWRMRLEQAAFWLRETDAAVADVARRSGFRSAAHFSSRFRGCYGVSPTGFRRQYDRVAAD